MVFDSPVTMDALILNKDTHYSPWRYNKLVVTAKVSFFLFRSDMIFLKGENYTWSDCTTAGNGAPFDIGNHQLRFPFNGTELINEIELAFNDPAEVSQFRELEFENAHQGNQALYNSYMVDNRMFDFD